ncbi:hypothetical protein MycrhDRAFT_5579 [Mycolicibacterium rhodesiae JS60]|nr:hypothetical protein MycrhDRAFT_5579 [Mycolicibacterium rhodesiae JS60]
MSAPVLKPARNWWVPDYLFGSMRHWNAPTPTPVTEACGCRQYGGHDVIHCVGRLQHLRDTALGRAPRSRCGARLARAQPSALLADGAPLCPACAAITHTPTDQVRRFNRRRD